MKFTLKKSQIAAMLVIAPKSDIRYYLNGIHIMQDERGTILEVTDGHMGARLRVDQTPVQLGENKTAKSAIIKRGDAEKLIAQKERYDYPVEFEVVDLEADPETGFQRRKIIAKVLGATYEFTPEDGRFPLLDMVKPKPYEQSPAWFNPDLVSAMGKAISTLFDVKKGLSLAKSWCIIPNGEACAIVRYCDSDDFYGFIMPIKAGLAEASTVLPW